MDCEGFGGMDESQNHDTRIFLFALLLSSYFVYNSTGNIDETALQTLSLVVNLAKEIRMKSNDKDIPSEDEIAENFPSFLWIVRDFALRLEDKEHNPITSKQYLEKALEFVKGCGDEANIKNRIRKLLTHFFRDRDCVTMVRPVELEQDLQRLDSLPDKFLREEFLKQSNLVRTKILKKTKPKKVNGKVVTSEVLLHLANGYAASVNNGKVPTIESAWNYVCKEKANEIAKECIRSIDQMIDSDDSIKAMINDEKDWKSEIRSRLIAKFNQAKFVDSAELSDRQAQLEKEIDNRLETISKKMNHEQSGVATKWLNSEFTQIDDLIKQDLLDSPRKANALLDEMESKFHNSNKKIPERQREKILKEFRLEKEARILSAIMRSKQEQQRKASAEQNAKLQAIEREASLNKLTFEEEKSKLADKVRQLEDAQITSVHTVASLQEKLNHCQEKADYERQRASEKESMHKMAFDDMVRRFEAEIDSLNSKLNNRETELLKATSEKDKFEMMLEQQKKLSHDTIDSLKKRLTDSETQLNQVKERENGLNQKIKSMAKSEELKEARDQLETMRSKKRMLENENTEIKAEKQYLENQINFYKDQIDDNKKLQDTLLGALQQQLKVDDDNTASELLATNKNLGTSLGKAEARIKSLETKLGRYKLYKQMVAGAKAFQCKETGKMINKNGFLAHLQHLEKASKQGDRDSDDSMIKPAEQVVKITQTMIKECPDTGRAFTEYLMHIKYARNWWKISRTYKEFCELNHNLVKSFPTIKLPDSANHILGFGGNVSSLLSSKKKAILEDRRTALEEYLNDLFRIPQIATCPALREFLKIDIYVDESGLSKQGDSLPKSPYRGDGSICDITSMHKNSSYYDGESAAKYSVSGSDFRRDRLYKENHSLINQH